MKQEAKLKRFAIRNLKPNPFRDIDNYQLNEEKIEALQNSIDVSGWWANILVRETPKGPELAYGHHRVEALRRKFGADHEVAVLVKDLSDDVMLRAMVQENLSVWGGGAMTMLENVRATVRALAEGRISEFPAPNPKARDSQLRYAPSFIMGADVSGPATHIPYTAAAIAQYHGFRADDLVKEALATLEAIERRELEERDLADLTDTQAREIGAQVAAARRDVETRVEHIQKAAEDAPPAQRRTLERKLERAKQDVTEVPRSVGKKLADEAKRRGRENVSRQDIREKGRELRAQYVVPKKQTIDAEAVVKKITAHLYDMTRDDHPAIGALIIMANHLEAFQPSQIASIEKALRTAIDRLEVYAGSIEPMTNRETDVVDAELVSELQA